MKNQDHENKRKELWVRAFILMAQSEIRAYSIMPITDVDGSPTAVKYANKCLEYFDEKFTD